MLGRGRVIGIVKVGRPDAEGLTMTERRRLRAWVAASLVLACAGCLPTPVHETNDVEPVQEDREPAGLAPDPGVGVTPGESCNAPAPDGASEAALGYMVAIDKATPGWRQVDENIRATGDSHRNDLPIQVRADRGFVDALGKLDWPDDAKATAENLIAIVGEYDEMLLAGYETHGFLAEHRDEVGRLDSARAATSGLLRDVLGLEPSRCTFWRP